MYSFTTAKKTKLRINSIYYRKIEHSIYNDKHFGLFCGPQVVVCKIQNLPCSPQVVPEKF